MAKKKIVRKLRMVSVSTPKGHFFATLTKDEKSLFQLVIAERSTTPIKEETQEIISYIKKVLRIAPSPTDFKDKSLTNAVLTANGKKITEYLDQKEMTPKLALEEVPGEVTPAKGIKGKPGFKAEQILSYERKIEKDLGLKVVPYFEEVPTTEKVASFTDSSKLQQKEYATIDIHCNLTNKLIRQFVKNYIQFNYKK